MRLVYQTLYNTESPPAANTQEANTDRGVASPRYTVLVRGGGGGG